MKNALLTALALGLMSGSAMAHEQQYDNTRELSDSPHKAEPPTGGHSSLASAATNPIANLIQFQIQDAYTPSNNNVSGSSNAFILQPVIPIKLSWEAVPLLLTRTTLPYINTLDFDGGIGTQEGFGDIAQQGFFLPKLETRRVMPGIGYNLTIPTGGANDFVGSGKWSIGPGAVYMNLQTPPWQWGGMAYSSFSFASQDSDRSHASNISIQPYAHQTF
jgi:hypothetical protein